MPGFARLDSRGRLSPHKFIRATSQLTAGTILGPGFFLASSR
jgi:hypothetical protein